MIDCGNDPVGDQRMTRIEDRRNAKVAAKLKQYERTKFKANEIDSRDGQWGWRSKYAAHIGAKERARHAGKPDGLMHGGYHAR